MSEMLEKILSNENIEKAYRSVYKGREGRRSAPRGAELTPRWGVTVRDCCGNGPSGAKTAPQRELRTHLLPKVALWRQVDATAAVSYGVAAGTCPVAPN